MRTEHFRVLHLGRLTLFYGQGIQFAQKAINLGESVTHYQALTKTRNFIDRRYFVKAAWWLGYADALALHDKETVHVIERPSPRRNK